MSDETREIIEDARYAEMEAMHATHCFACGDPLPARRKPGDSPFCGYACAAQPGPRGEAA